MAITVSGTSITFNDSTVQTTAGNAGTMELITSIVSGVPTSYALAVPSPQSYNQLILVWSCNQFSGPVTSTLNLTESISGSLYTALTAGSFIGTNNSASPSVTQITTTSGTNNFLAAINSLNSWSRGQAIMTRIKNADTTTGSRYHISLCGGSTSNLFQVDYTATGTAAANSYFITTVTLGFSSTNSFNIRLYGVRI